MRSSSPCSCCFASGWEASATGISSHACADPRLEESDVGPGRVSYELRRLHLHGLIKRTEGAGRYRLTREGLGTVVFYQRAYCQNHPPGPLRYPQHLLPPGPANRSRLP